MIWILWMLQLLALIVMLTLEAIVALLVLIAWGVSALWEVAVEANANRKAARDG